MRSPRITGIVGHTSLDKDGHAWRLYQDGDLFATCDELMSDEEYEELFGESRCS